MKAIMICLFVFAVATSKAQTTTTATRYYNSPYLEKEVPADKAKYSQTLIEQNDGTATVYVTNLKSGEIINSRTFKGNVPYGIWKIQRGSGLKASVIDLDYNFDLVYTDTTAHCPDSIAGLKDALTDNVSLGYTAPDISMDEMTFTQYLSTNTFYPASARENGIEGIVVLSFNITEAGVVDNIKVRRGVNIALDKEAVRVVRGLKLSSPPMLNGMPHKLCLMLPFTFQLS